MKRFMLLLLLFSSAIPILLAQQPQPVKNDTTSVSTLPPSTQDHYPTEKGSIMVSGSLSFSSVSSMNSTTIPASGLSSGSSLTSLSLTPNATYFLTSRFGLGLDVSYSIISEDNSKLYETAIGPKLILALGKLQNVVRPYLSLGVDYLSISETREIYNEYSFSSITETHAGSIVKFGFGSMIICGENLAIPVEISYLITSVGDQQTSTMGASVGLAGFFY